MLDEFQGEMVMLHMRSQTRDGNVDGDASELRDRRSGRGWGPFSGGQLTIIVVTFAILLLFPIGAWAVSGSSVFVTDAGTGQHATVNAAGALTVAQAAPKSFFSRGIELGTSYSKVLAAPARSALIVTQLEINTLKATTTGEGHWISISVSRTNNTCSSVVGDPVSGLPTLELNPSAVGMTTIPFQPGLVVPANRSLCAINNDLANVDAQVYAFGSEQPGIGQVRAVPAYM